MRGLIAIFKHTTTFPIPIKIDKDAERIGKGYKLFPIIGIVIGLFLFLVSYLVKDYHSSLIKGILITLTGIIITGGKHINGLAGTFDGVFGFKSKHRMLDRMKDPSIGSNGAIAIFVVLILKTLLYGEMEPEVLIIVPVVGRLNGVINAAVSPYARLTSTSISKNLIKYTKVRDIIIPFLITIGYLIVVKHITDLSLTKLLSAFIGTSLLGIFYAWRMAKKIGGVTGETLGSIVELSEIMFVLVFYLLAD